MAKHIRPSMQTDYAVNICACLDRFSLDSVGFTSPTLKEIVDKHLSEEPLRVLESVTIEWHVSGRVLTQYRDGLTTTLEPESPLGKSVTYHGLYGDENGVEDADDDDEDKDGKILRKTAAMCAKSFVKYFKIEEYGNWRAFLHAFQEHLPGIRIQGLTMVDYVQRPRFGGVMRTARFKFERRIIELARGVETLLMKTERADVGADSLQWLKEHGIRRLAVDDDYKLVDADGVRAFCFGGSETEDKAAPNRSMYLQEANLSFEFLQQLAQECLATDGSRMPTVTFYRYEDFVPPLPEHLAHSRHVKDRHPCLHFRFDAPAGPYEIVAQSRGDQ
ncbi:hypothetical protein AAVH_24831 [Aphelenchoides avenae]|nr:hypothetical protein AAVH_24831 [Aphelenchus avenae]